MKRRIVTIAIIFFAVISSFAQKYHYEGGFFEKKGNFWYDFKDENPDKIVNRFTQIESDVDYYYGDNGQFRVAIPKTKNKDFLFLRNGSDKWELLFPNKVSLSERQNHLKYFYEGGFFEKRDNHWIEYKDNNPEKAVNWFTGINEDKNFFIGDNGNCKIAIPKSIQNNFMILLKGYNEWQYKYKSKFIPTQNDTKNVTTNNKPRTIPNGNVPSVRIDEVTFSHNATDPLETLAEIYSFGMYQPNEYGIYICVKVSICNLLNKSLNANAYFYDMNGKIIKDKNKRYRSTDGQVSVGETFKPDSQNYNSKKIGLFIPYSEFHCEKGKKLKCIIEIIDNVAGKCIAKSDVYNFTLSY